MSRSNRHRCEVIEVYPDHGGKAVIKMTSGRIECVGPVGDCQTFAVGQRGWVASWSPPAGTGDAMASESPEFLRLLRARRLRERDAVMREALGLRFDGLQYFSSSPENWRSPPRERYVDARGRKWLRHGPADYRLVPKRAEEYCVIV